MTNNKKIYSLLICYDEDNDVIEWVEESIDREEELPDNIYETKDLKELENIRETNLVRRFQSKLRYLILLSKRVLTN